MNKLKVFITNTVVLVIVVAIGYGFVMIVIEDWQRMQLKPYVTHRDEIIGVQYLRGGFLNGPDKTAVELSTGETVMLDGIIPLPPGRVELIYDPRNGRRTLRAVPGEVSP